MKRTAWLLVCLAVVACGSLVAQASDGNSLLRANIPFAFSVQNVSFSAGTYTLFEENGILHVRNEQDRSEKTFLAFPAIRAGASKSVLRFTDIDGKKYLSSIWGQESRYGFEVSQTTRTAEQPVAAEGSR